MSRITITDLRFMIITMLFGLPLMGLGLWWAVFLAGMLAAFVTRPWQWRRALLVGFITGLLIWLTWSLVAYFDGGQIITSRVAETFGAHPIILLLVGGCIGGLLTGLGAMAGNIKQIW